MLKKEMNYIELSGESYPIKCDMIVLEQLQDIFGSIEVFEEKILGYYVKKDENGEKVLDASGESVLVSKIPDPMAVGTALELFTAEGLEIEEKPPVERKTLLRKVDKRYTDLAMELHAEFMRCFERKNGETPQKN